MLNTLSLYCKENKLTVNTNKTKIVIFQKAGRKASIRPFEYRGSALETVNKFTYLGVPFSSSGLFNEATSSFTGKARNAMGALWKILTANKLNNWQKRSALFESLVTSVLLYCSGIWGLNHMMEIDKTQRNFMKIVLGIPKSTPGYMLRKETGTYPLEIQILKRALSYLVKIRNRQDSHLSKICLEQLKALHASSTKGNLRNWYTGIVETLRETNHEHLLDMAPAHLEANLESILEARKTLWYQRDTDRINNSTYSSRYKDIASRNTLPQRETYLDLKIPIDMTRVIAQLRLTGDERINIRTKNFSYKINATEICSLCNLNQHESLEHILSNCPVYEHIRLECDFQLNILETLNNLNKVKLYKIYNFVIKCLRHRSLCLNI